MKIKLQYLFLVLAATAGIHRVAAQGMAFTYQGRLNFNGAPANGNFDVAIALYSTNAGGNAFAGPVTERRRSLSHVRAAASPFHGRRRLLDLSCNKLRLWTRAIGRQSVTLIPTTGQIRA